MLGVLSLFLMSVLGLALATDLASDRAILLGLVFTGTACAVAAVLVFSSAAEAAAETLLAGVPWERARRAPTQVLGSIRRYAHHHGSLTNVLAASVAVQALRVLQAYYLGAAIGLSQPLIVYSRSSRSSCSSCCYRHRQRHRRHRRLSSGFRAWGRHEVCLVGPVRGARIVGNLPARRWS
jgi:hypothetical protein